ncbi:hypothetical protein G7077_05125 [Sphingomonas piscis]|uniref:Uncharacterized protein n=1 Tax=Sphingomonas piscis TaxID=2714943 RepID=A0A6G7YNQ9_9SPHN|nr:hypothetical protein [Sphingomonas piscis]QIK78380.1 hypothetical protein G7077_05125 [Sphingomonas piscis]
MALLSPVQPLGVHYETCENFNALVALEIARGDGTLPALLQCFRAAARDLASIYPHPLLDEVASAPLGSRASIRSLELACADEGVIENLCALFFQKAADLRLIDLVQHDPHLAAHSVLSSLWNSEMWQADCTMFRHSWRVEHAYKAKGWHLLSPWIFLFGSQMPRLRQLHKIDASLINVAQTGSSVLATSLLRRAGLPVTDHNLELIWFLCCNRAEVCVVGRGSDARILPTEVAIPDFGLLSEISTVEGWVKNPCKRWTSRLTDSQNIEADLPELEKFLRRSSRATLISTSDVAIKIALQQLAADQTEQGLPQHLRRVIIRMLEGEPKVVKVTDLRRALGVPHLRIDPFSVTSGRVLVYAPSPKFLDPSETAFVLREWVQDAGHQRARIAPDRILTPLRPVVWRATEETLLAAIRQSRSFKLFGIAFWPDIRRAMQLEVPPQAKRWADNHLWQGAERTLKRRGFILAGEVIFSGARWQGLPSSRAALRQAAKDLRSSPDWLELRECYLSEMLDVAHRLVA